MDSLPEECIVQVLAFVTSSPRSLHALLLTNRTLFRLSAAILYHNPFEYLERHVAYIQDRQAQQVKVLRLFLACIPDTLDAITTSSATSNTPLPGFRRPTIDYLSLYNCHFEKLLQFLITPALSHIPSATFASVPTFSAQQDRSVSSKQSTPQSHAQPRQLLPGLTGVHEKIHLGLVGHTPQHIHTIGYSIHGLSTLLPLVDQLSRLVRLELYKKSDRREISTATDFILAHRRIHQSLQEIKIKSAGASFVDLAPRMKKNTSSAHDDQSDPPTLIQPKDQSDLSPLIQAMGQPRVIDVSNWADADLYLHLFPLEQCRVLQMRQGLSRSASSLPADILSRLFNAKVLRLPAFHQDMFSWATGRESTGSAEAILERGLSLPSIVSINLYGIDTHMVPAFADAIAAFHPTLQTLIGLSSFDRPSTLVLGWSQSLPRLTHIDLEGTIALRFNLTCLSHCTVIRNLRLNIGRKIPESWNPSLKAQQLAQVSPSLRSLDIAGWWRLPDSCFTETLLPVFQRLWRLNVMWCDGPTVDVLLQFVDKLPSLTWLGIIATQQEHDLVLEQCAISNPFLEIDVHIKDQ
ncbi:hypothetical protein EC957_004668 [Mortierella hygrophila]|uniref:Uncharacterized protein n=1 Tax=Mortierella hygrophila TaxID=979708 RepID=A0A9P6K085_9FUNG|nr:hypothetical protein EC957_004668 [Mortierella hygrophila]